MFLFFLTLLVTLVDVSLARFSRPPKARSREAAAWLLFSGGGESWGESCGGTVASRYFGKNLEKKTRDILGRLYFCDEIYVFDFMAMEMLQNSIPVKGLPLFTAYY